MNFSRQNLLPTYLKYFISYLIIFSILILGFFFIMRTKLTDSYFDQRYQQIQFQLEHFSNQLNEDILYLLQTDQAISSNPDITENRYHTTGSYQYVVSKKLREIILSSRLISSIVYMPKNTQNVLSMQNKVEYRDDVFYIVDTQMNEIPFDPSPYFDALVGQMIFLPGDTSSYLIYFPATKSDSNYIFFYFLDMRSIEVQLKSLISEEIPAIALTDDKGNIILGPNSAKLAPYLDNLQHGVNTYQPTSDRYIYVQGGINGSFSLIALLSNDFMLDQINVAFADAYSTLLILTIVVFLLIFFVMQITYRPLHQLVQTIVPNPDAHKNYEQQISIAFQSSRQQNLELQSKLQNYRLSIKKSLLDSLLNAQYEGTDNDLPNIDSLFDNTMYNRKIYVIKISCDEESVKASDIITHFKNTIGPDSCFQLKSQSQHVVLLIHFIGNISNTKQIIKDLCQELYKKTGLRSAISNSSGSPLDIPSLYEHASFAGKFWNHEAVVEYQHQMADESSYTYPHDQLNQLSDLLKDHNFHSARSLIRNVFQKLCPHTETGTNLPTFFVNCILIDILTVIINDMNLSHIDFSAYSDRYYSILYLCRSFSFEEKRDEIMLHIQQLLDFYEDEQTCKLINTAPLKQLMEDCYCQPDFSISTVADKFHVSISHMSALFKQEMNIGFADYLWLLRLTKAKELLLTTDSSIDDISLAIGYTTPSSFRRKFKQETGMTPSQFRADNQP